MEQPTSVETKPKEQPAEPERAKPAPQPQEAQEQKPIARLPNQEEPGQRPESQEGRIVVEPTEHEKPLPASHPPEPSETIGQSERKGPEEPQPENRLAPPEKKFEARALSLRVLQDKLKQCNEDGTCPEDLLTLCGMNRVFGYVVDGARKDLVLVGQVDKLLPKLHLADFVVAMRNVWSGLEPPGCSIDPDPAVISELQEITAGENVRPNSRKLKESVRKWKEVCSRPQSIRVMGVNSDTRFAQVMIHADYYMKRLVNGSVDLGIDGFRSLSHMTWDLVRSRLEDNGSFSIPPFAFNRFWFSPGDYRFIEDADSAWIKDSGVVLLTEEEFLTKSGQIVGSGKPDRLAQQFAKAFSNSYSEIAKKRPIYSELESLYRFVALAKVMNYKQAAEESGLPLDYLLTDYPVNTTSVPETLAGLSNVNELQHRKEDMEYYVCLKHCGGVSMDISVDNNVFIPASREVSVTITQDVVSARPASDTLSWTVTTRSPDELWSTWPNHPLMSTSNWVLTGILLYVCESSNLSEVLRYPN